MNDVLSLHRRWRFGPHAREFQDQTMWNARIQTFSGGRRRRRVEGAGRQTQSNKLIVQQIPWNTQSLYLQHLYLSLLVTVYISNLWRQRWKAVWKQSNGEEQSFLYEVFPFLRIFEPSTHPRLPPNVCVMEVLGYEMHRLWLLNLLVKKNNPKQNS